MLEDLFSKTVSKRLYVGPLEPSLNSFAALLLERGYTRPNVKDKIRFVARLSKWLHQQHLEVNDLNDQLIDQFIKRKGRKGPVRRGDFATLRLLFKHLGCANPPAPVVDENYIRHRIEKGYAQYLSQERGLSPAALANYIPMVRRFLSDRFNESTIRIDRLCPRDVTTFLLSYTKTAKRRTAKLMVTSLRSFFRYLRMRGEIAIDLAEFIPTVSDWRLSDLPKSLEPQQVACLLSACDQSSKVGQRDYTVLLLLARLGLRAGEVAAMNLDDINWEAGELVICGKGPRKDRLPIPCDVGEALVAYLQHGRPVCSSRRVFIRARAPHQGFSSSVAVCDIVRRALVRANLHPPCKGAHMLRHSLAVHMLHKGASLGEIGELLRHASQTTTEIYTKVDMAALRSLSQPWPGGVA
jgi:site-specific recombinase XerD